MASTTINAPAMALKGLVLTRTQARTARRSPLRRYRVWVSRHWLLAAAIAGVFSTHIATIFGYWFYSFKLPQLPWDQVNGALYTPKSSPSVQFFSGFLYHYADGLVFTVLFAITLHPLLPWRSTPVGNVLKGFVFGTILATISCAWMTPYVYNPHSGAGIFSTGFGWKLVLAIYIWHWIFGLHVGTFLNPLSEEELAAEPSAIDPRAESINGVTVHPHN